MLPWARPAAVSISIAAIAAAGMFSLAGAATLDQELAAALQAELDRQGDLRLAAGVEDSIWRDVRVFYRRRGHRLLWSEDLRPRPMAQELVEAIGEARAAGLTPEDYGERRLRALLEEAGDPPGLAALDVLATESFVRYGLHLARGRVEPTAVDREWRVAPRRADVWGALASADAGEPLNQALFALEPRSRLYQDTKLAYASLRTVSERGGWGTVSAGAPLHNGMKAPRVEELRRRLAAAGALPTKARKGRKFDAAVENAVRDFQARHLLEVTGVVDTGTITALNVPVEERLYQLALNLERARWMADDPPGLGVFVNVPDFTLIVMDRDRELLRSRVIAGRFYHPTPVLNDSIVTVVANPTWSVPQSIATAEILPAVQRDSSYLERKHIRVFARERRGLREIDPASVNWDEVMAENFRYQFRQDAGPENPLGRVKFVLTNDQFIYLHDTPSADLFERADRTGSYGCIRIEKPFALAAIVLGQSGDGPQWEEIATAESITTTETRSFPVHPAVPVRVTYWTAWADAAGNVQWRVDPYRIDFLHDWALKNRYQPDPYAAAEALGEPSAELRAAEPAAAGGGVAAPTQKRRQTRR